MAVQIVPNPPPEHIYSRARLYFGKDVDFEKGVVFTVGENIHSAVPVSENLFQHELLHVSQQKNFPGGFDKWWNRYFEDADFRFEQELSAYRRQYGFFCSQTKNRDHRFKFLYRIALDLSGPLYGRMATHNKCMELIRS